MALPWTGHRKLPKKNTVLEKKAMEYTIWDYRVKENI